MLAANRMFIAVLTLALIAMPAYAAPAWPPFAQPPAGDAYWNTPIPANPKIANNSAAMISQITNYVYIGWTEVPIYNSTSSDPTYTETCTLYGGCPGTCNKAYASNNCPTSFTLHIPSGAVIGGPGDYEMVVIDKSASTSNPVQWKVYDMFQAQNWKSGSVGQIGEANYTSSGIGDGQTGPDWNQLIGQITYGEAASGTINHALRVGSGDVCSGVKLFPALKTDGPYSNSNCVPEGSRLWLDSGVNCASVTPKGDQMICYAMQKYGAYVGDVAGSNGGITFGAQNLTNGSQYYSTNLGWQWMYWYVGKSTIDWKNHLHVLAAWNATNGGPVTTTSTTTVPPTSSTSRSTTSTTSSTSSTTRSTSTTSSTTSIHTSSTTVPVTTISSSTTSSSTATSSSTTTAPGTTVSTVSTTTISGTINAPPGTLYYVPITITNSQPSPVPQNGQVRVNVNPSTYMAYEAGNLQNVEFFYGNGTVVPSWLESGNSNSSSGAVYWLRLPTGIAGGNSVTIYMGFASLQTNRFNNMNDGEAPQLSSTYGQYDDGSSVFLAYFDGNTGLSNLSAGSGLTVQHESGITYGSSKINTINIAGYGSSGWYGIVLSRPIPNQPVIVESSFQNLNNLDDMGAASLESDSSENLVSDAISVDMGFSYSYFTNDYLKSGAQTDDLNQQGSSPNTNWNYATLNYSGPSSTSWSGFIAPQLYSSSGGYSGTVNSNPLSRDSNIYVGTIGATSSNYQWNENINWMRARTAPPSGAMPAAAFGGVVATGLSSSTSSSTSSTTMSTTASTTTLMPGQTTTTTSSSTSTSSTTTAAPGATTTTTTQLSSTSTAMPTTTGPTTTAGGNGGSGGGGSGGGGGGGTQKPTVRNITGGYEISNFTQYEYVSINTTGYGRIKVTQNYITPTSAGVSLNSESVAMSPNTTVYIGNFSGSKYYAKLVGISYLPIEDTIKLDVFTNVTPANVTAPIVYTYNVSGTTSLFTSEISRLATLEFNLTSLKLHLIVSTPNSSYLPMRLSFSRPAGLGAPQGYEALLITNLTLSSNDSLDSSAAFVYPCSDQGVKPYLFSNNMWTEISNFTNNRNSCTLSFMLPDDPVVGIFASNTTTTTSSVYTSVPATTTVIQKPAQQSGYTGLLIVVGALVLIALLLYLYLRGRMKPPGLKPVAAAGNAGGAAGS